jgi:hypothetical protein
VALTSRSRVTRVESHIARFLEVSYCLYRDLTANTNSTCMIPGDGHLNADFASRARANSTYLLTPTSAIGTTPRSSRI